jgi:hypothetical protein
MRDGIVCIGLAGIAKVKGGTPTIVVARIKGKSFAKGIYYKVILIIVRMTVGSIGTGLKVKAYFVSLFVLSHC